ncbi:MAG: hypothetical protein PHU28_00695 [Methanosarcinaceae archaeon]|nr:hypothetical protein [Methanosarcinaceae archaeon]
MGRADDMSYIGEYLQIATSGHFAEWDIYPASHIIGASISLLSNLEAHETSFLISGIFSLMFIAGMLLFSRQLIKNSCINSIILPSAFILYTGTYNFLNVPHALFFAMIPLFLYCFIKYLQSEGKVSASIIFILLTLILPITHPFIAFLSIFLFLYHMVLEKYYKRKQGLKTISQTSFMVLVFAFAGWFIYNNTLLVKFRRNFQGFIQKITVPVYYETTGKLATINLDAAELFKLCTVYYGRYIIPTLFILISVPLLLKNKLYTKKKALKNLPYFILLYLVLLFVQMILLLNPIISHQSDRITNLNFIVYAQVPLFAYSLYVLFFQNKNKRNGIIVAGILTCVWSLSLFGCFDSPNVYKTNVALTQNEVDGMDWFFKVNEDLSVSVPLSQINRFDDLFNNQKRIPKIKKLPDHFGYTNNTATFTKINLNPNEETYVIILAMDEFLYQKVPGYSNIGRYNKNDFLRFRKDISINKIYTSLNIEIFKSKEVLP